jgi:peptidoglycan hydrolase-like protein with peptidoglycan-binding domain
MKLADIITQNLVLEEKQLASDAELIRQIQVRFAELGYYPKQGIDGTYGPKTIAANVNFCGDYHLDNFRTGKYGATWARALVEAKVESKTLTIADYQMCADFLNCSLAAVRAVVQVEAAGGGFFGDGRPKILFEAHLFDKFTNGKYRAQSPNISSPTWNRALYFGGPREYQRLERAKVLNHDAALMATSWGLGQVLGMNYQVCGYKSVSDFVEDMYASEGKQLMAMCAFIKNNGLDKYLRNRDFTSFARGYNGPGFRQNNYHVKLANAFEQHLA